MNARLLSLLVACCVSAGSAASAQQSRRPPWDARGTGPLPRFGVASLDVRDDGTIVVGTIAAFGDPNVLVLDASGAVIRSHKVGQQWIDRVAFGPGVDEAFAVCTMPEGRAGDVPQVFRLTGERAVADKANQESAVLFHYGDHSNHPTLQLARTGDWTATLLGRNVVWHGAQEGSFRLPLTEDEASVAIAVDETGVAVVGGIALEAGKRPNLHLLRPSEKKPLWTRMPATEVEQAPAPERGLYGSPTLPDGRREPLPQRDEKTWASLAVAIHRDPNGKRKIAAADCQGWQRWVRSSATMKDSNQGLRFTPTRPTLSIYAEDGTLVRRFGPETFAAPLWCDLQFSPDGKRLYAWPHSWRCRGLAGQPTLPADEVADTFFALDIETGEVRRVRFPDAIADAAVGSDGSIAVSCWNGKIYWLPTADAELPAGFQVGGPALVRMSHGGARLAVAEAKGTIRILDRKGKTLHATNLDEAVPRTPKAWVADARATPIVKGLWQLPGGRVESDLGGQRLLEGPDGYILIEAHAGLSFEREWEAIRAAGLDPRKVKYVLATHEHGDHAPGAYLWRVVAGAQFVCSEEMAYTLQHHVPINTGYGLHPPVPTDIRIRTDVDLDLAGAKVRAVKIPGHTFGSMAWRFAQDPKTFVAFGDLIMPRGVLGYSGSVNFSATDALASLRKLQSLKPDLVLPGHGAIESPDNYLGAGIDVGAAVGWGFIDPERPDPRFRLSQTNVDVVGWGRKATSAAFGDLDGDGRPDVALVAPRGEGSVVLIFVNRRGRFADRPDHEIVVPHVAEPHKIRIEASSKGPLIFVAGKSAAILEADGAWPRCRIAAIDLGDGNMLRSVGADLLTCRRFGAFQRIAADKEKLRLAPFQPEISGPYVDFRVVPLKEGKRDALVSAYGRIWVRDVSGGFPSEPTFDLGSGAKDWAFLAVGDFNADGRADLAFLSYGMNQETNARVHYQRAEGRSFADQPDIVVPLWPRKEKNRPPLVRDNPVVADWNGDGIDDLIVAHGQSDEIHIYLGGKDGLQAARRESLRLDYRIHYEHGVFVGDFDGDGRPDLAAFGYTNTGVGAGGPPAAYIYRRTK